MNRLHHQHRTTSSPDLISTRKKIQFHVFPRIKAFLSTRYGLITSVGLFVVFFNEIFIYQYARFCWPNIKHLKTSNVEKLLLVADPQLIGEKDEGLFGMITRRDADRYLSNTFAQAKSYLNPDWTLFLGDIFDEGLSATDDEYKRYYTRFQNIFQYNDKQQKSIVIPGDNDVGGEYFGDKKPYLKQRFKNYFGRIIALYEQNDVEFLKLDVDMYESYVDNKRSMIGEQTQHRSMKSKFRIILNHWPLISRSVRFVKPFVEELNPNLILRGDSHQFTLSTHDRSTSLTRLIARDTVPNEILPLNVNDRRFIYEISIPTCSYRMGVLKIGYGVLLLDASTHTAHLTILWTPRRYLALYIYAAYGIFILSVLLLAPIITRRTMMRWFIITRRFKMFFFRK